MTCGFCRGICQWGYLKFVSNPASESSKNRRYILLLWSLLLSTLLLLLQCVNVCPNIWPEINFGIWTIKNKTNPISFDINLQHYSRSQQQIFLFLSFPLSLCPSLRLYLSLSLSLPVIVCLRLYCLSLPPPLPFCNLHFRLPPVW